MFFKRRDIKKPRINEFLGFDDLFASSWLSYTILFFLSFRRRRNHISCSLYEISPVGRNDKIENYTNLFATKYSAIWIVFVAAPFLKLSATIHILMVLGWLSSLRILPTKTSSFPCA